MSAGAFHVAGCVVCDKAIIGGQPGDIWLCSDHSGEPYAVKVWPPANPAPPAPVVVEPEPVHDCPWCKCGEPEPEPPRYPGETEPPEPIMERCPVCQGTGWAGRQEGPPAALRFVACAACHGTGQIPYVP